MDLEICCVENVTGGRAATQASAFSAAGRRPEFAAWGQSGFWDRTSFCSRRNHATTHPTSVCKE